MTPPHDKQTETELDAIFKQYKYRCNMDIYATPDLEDMELVRRLTEHEDWLKSSIEAWSRQQTAEVLDKLLEEKRTYVDFVDVAAIEAKLDELRRDLDEALRVGLEGRK